MTGLAIGLGIAVGLALVAFVLLITGRLTIDTGWGRRIRPLGPQVAVIRAPRERIFDLIAVPYLSDRPPKALREKIEVLDRGEDMVLAAHRTPSSWFATTTVETVTFERPGRIGFRLVRGPVPFVRERFVLRELDGGTATELTYDGELGADGWVLGTLWGRVVAGRWEATVAASLEALRETAESDAGRRRTDRA
ncbi:MAG: SRPBCC family protein [Actinomycetota bacterium]|nr:SRPBCC family protein [Actinomycetota bacterium]